MSALAIIVGFFVGAALAKCLRKNRAAVQEVARRAETYQQDLKLIALAGGDGYQALHLK